VADNGKVEVTVSAKTVEAKTEWDQLTHFLFYYIFEVITIIKLNIFSFFESIKLYWHQHCNQLLYKTWWMEEWLILIKL
jgi:hypothetical protein